MPSQAYVNITATAAWQTTKTVTGFDTVKWATGLGRTLSPSAAAGSANVTYAEQRTLGAAATQTYDLQSLTHPATGESITMNKLYAIVLDVTTGQVEIGPGATNGLQFRFGAATDSLICTPGVYIIAVESAYTVDASNKTFDFVGGGSGATYEVAFIGGTA